MSTGVSDAGAVITELGVEIFDLHMLIFWICVVIGIGVFGVMLYSIYAHRKSKGVEPAQFHGTERAPHLLISGAHRSNTA